jgi:ribonuclease Z
MRAMSAAWAHPLKSRYADRELKVLLDEAREIFPNTVLTKDRMCFPIEFVD